jgi:peptide/nickel transport system substrate-binding protein
MHEFDNLLGAKVPPRTLAFVTNNPKTSRFVLAVTAVAWGCFLASCTEVTSLDDPRVFRYNESAAITSLDPAAARSLEHMWVVDQLYDGLVELTPDLEVVPCLARSWTFNDSSLTYRFLLRDDVTFTTGKRMTATDVVVSLERLRDPKVISSGGWILDAVVPEGIVAVNDSTVDIRLNKAYPPFLGLLTTAYGSILDGEAHLTSGSNLRSEPLGSGPFELAWWLPDAGLVMHRNERYWERDEEGNRLPYLEAIHVDVVQDMGAEFLGLTQRRYDFISGLHPAYMETLLDEEGELRARFESTLRHEHRPFLKTDYLGIRLDGKETPSALRDVRVRQAMSLALDRHGLAKHLRRNAVTPTDHFVPPTMLGLAAPPAVTQDLEQARALLLEAGHPEGRGVGEIVLSTTSDYVDMCAAFQHDWANIGLDVKVDVVPASVHREKVAQGECAMFYKSWLADHADAENFLGLFTEANFAPGGPNYTHFKDGDFERLFSGALNETENREARLSIYAQLDSLVHSSMPVIPLFHDEVTHILSNKVSGWRIHPVNRLDLRRVTKE